MAGESWYFVERGQPVGPVTFDQLRQRAAGGALGGNDLVCVEGAGSWQVAYSVPGLFAAPAGVARATPPVPPGPPGDALDDLASANASSHYGGQAQPPLGYGGYPAGGQGYEGHYPGPRMGQSQQGMAIAGFVLSFVFSPLGLIFSAIALSGMGKNRNDEGKGFAVAGLVLSIIFMLFGCLWFFAVASVVNRARW